MFKTLICNRRYRRSGTRRALNTTIEKNKKMFYDSVLTGVKWGDRFGGGGGGGDLEEEEGEEEDEGAMFLIGIAYYFGCFVSVMTHI